MKPTKSFPRQQQQVGNYQFTEHDVILQFSKLLAQAQHKVAPAPSKTLRAHGRTKVSSSSAASQEPQPAGSRLWVKLGFQSPKDLGLRLCLDTLSTQDLRAGFASGQLFPLWSKGWVPTDFHYSPTPPWHPCGAGDPCPGCAAQPHGSPKPQQGLAAVYILSISDKAEFKVSHKPGTPCFRLIQRRSCTDMGSLSSAGPGREGRGWRRKGTGADGDHSPLVSTSHL